MQITLYNGLGFNLVPLLPSRRRGLSVSVLVSTHVDPLICFYNELLPIEE